MKRFYPAGERFIEQFTVPLTRNKLQISCHIFHQADSSALVAQGQLPGPVIGLRPHDQERAQPAFIKFIYSYQYIVFACCKARLFLIEAGK